MSTRFTISSKLRKPIWAMYCRTCSAMKKKKLMAFSGVPRNLARNAGSCVAMPTGQVLRWHLRIMMQPSATSGAVEKPNSSAPSSAAMVTSRPVCSLPSVCRRTRPRRSFITSTWWGSSGPQSPGAPAGVSGGNRPGAPAKVVHHQHRVGLCEAQFPGRAGVLDGGERAGAGAAGIARDQDDVGMRFGDARGHRSDTHLGHQLDRDAGPRVDVLQIVNQLRQILDGVDVVVRRRRDEAYAGDGVAHARDGLIDFVAGEHIGKAACR